jgi:hypothetical protein
MAIKKAKKLEQEYNSILSQKDSHIKVCCFNLSLLFLHYIWFTNLTVHLFSMIRLSVSK